MAKLCRLPERLFELSVTTFAELNLIPEVLRALQAVNYTVPTPIQAVAIPHLMEKRDLLGCAQTGTGKTAAFALPILSRLGAENRRAIPLAPRVLVLSPTRELAAQIGDSFATYGKFLKLRHACVFGGVGQNPQVRALQKGIHILVATPGRLLDLMDQGYIRLDALEIFVLDEADRMLDMGFLPDLKSIIAELPAKRHSLFFSATLPGKVAELAQTLLQNPIRVDVAPQSTTADRIEQQVLHVMQSQKSTLLAKVLLDPQVARALVFTRTKRGADKVAEDLNRAGVQSEAIHGNKSQNARTRILEKFRGNRFPVLVATDLAARGLDVDGITHVINYDLPIEAESYVHRIGRTARAGASGIAYTFCDPQEKSLLRQIERLLKVQIAVHADHPEPKSNGRHVPKQQQNGGRRPFPKHRRRPESSKA